MAIDTIRVVVNSRGAVDLRALEGLEDRTRYTVENVGAFMAYLLVDDTEPVLEVDGVRQRVSGHKLLPRGVMALRTVRFDEKPMWAWCGEEGQTVLLITEALR